LKRALWVFAAVFLMSAFLSAQQPFETQSSSEKRTAPAPAITDRGDNELSVSYVIPVRHDPWSSGYGADVTASRYFTRHVGFSADVDYVKSSYESFTAYGFRGGPVVRIAQIGPFEPFARGLFGYPYVGGFSYLAGAGTDFRIVGPFSARVAADFEHFERIHASVIEDLRFSIGCSYHFKKFGR
jgi:hypothetical protein